MIVWRKSSRSGNTSGNCVEVGAWRTSSRSTNTGGQNCVEAGAWRKSTHSSTSSGNCVEVAPYSDLAGIALRDTKDREGPMLTFTVSQWRGLVADLKRGDLEVR